MTNLDLIDAGSALSSERKNLSYADRIAAAEADNESLMAAFHHHFPNQTLKQARGEFAPTDGVILMGDKIIGVYEAKARLLTLNKLQTDYKNEWLLSETKLQAGCDAARALGCPFIGIIYLRPENALIRVKVWDEVFSRRIRYDNEETDAGAKGGTKVTRNAYINLDGIPVRRFGHEA
jgi:hypothetical protein